MAQTHDSDVSAETDRGLEAERDDSLYRPPVPGLPSTPPVDPDVEPPLAPADDPPATDPGSATPMPSPVTI